jgi:hypothetical protein
MYFLQIEELQKENDKAALTVNDNEEVEDENDEADEEDQEDEDDNCHADVVEDENDEADEEADEEDQEDEDDNCHADEEVMEIPCARKLIATLDGINRYIYKKFHSLYTNNLLNSGK